MAVPSRHEGSLHITDTLSAKVIRYPNASVDDDAVAASAGIQASKLEHAHFHDHQFFAEGATVEPTSSYLTHVVAGSTGQTLGFEAVFHTVASATSQLCYIDLQKATAATTFVSILTAPITLASSDPIRTPMPGVINTAALTDGDIIRQVVTTTGSTANFFKGLQTTYRWSEQYQ